LYRRHIQKLLLAAKAPRYVSKGNYALTRMGYLQQMFPDARFIIPVREPVGHIASLMRQHKRFCAAAAEDAQVAEHMALAGHFEFGPKRTPIHTGDDEAMAEIQAAWAAGDEVRGWALYWEMLHRFLLEQLERDAELKKACLLVRFDALCAKPLEVVKAVFAHCALPLDEDAAEALAARVSAPDYYDSAFSDAQKRCIADITGETAKRLGF
jgi:hypothetical protein